SDAPAPTCTKGTLKCSDDNKQVLMCKNNRWTSLAVCANGCADGRCISTATAKTCTEGALKCSDNGSQALVCVNDTWTAKETCAERCENGVCVSDPEQCTRGATKCSDDGKHALVCVNDTWLTTEICAERCENGVCVSTSAPDDPPHIPDNPPRAGETCTCYYENECSEDNKQVLLCDGNDSSGYIWTEEESCAYGCDNAHCILWACNEENGSAQCYGGTASICVDGLYQPVETCKYGCNEATGKCNYENRYFECADYPMSQIHFDNYVYNIGFEVDHNDRLEIERHGKFRDYCGEGYVGICRPSNNASPRSGFYHGDCYEPCSEEGQTLRTCRGVDLCNGIANVPSGVTVMPDDDFHVAEEYICTKVGNQLVYLLQYGIGTFACDMYYSCYDRSSPTFTCYSDDSLCSLFAYDISKYEEMGFTYYARVHKGCKGDEAECPEKCVNGCNFAGTVCLCPEDKCVYGCNDDGSCIWPENCPTTCKDGCYKGSSECFDKSLCNCEYKHFGPSHWGWSCEAYEDECSKFI
ncbi:MAG: hypothetical protein IJ268_09810, partial [Proteobacteria bacterium]|nr:hypothetical protein [Pseudomonadota bacterium]